MSALYIHIPYCKMLCYYCDFHFSLNLTTIQPYIQALCNELRLQSHFLPSSELSTIYFGGGTPSVLQEQDIAAIFNTISTYWHIQPQAEITFECNPDDLNKEYLQMLQSYSINRLSIGIQSFNDSDLQRLNRRHSAKQAKEALYLAQSAGFNSVSVDLIYGLPHQSVELWKQNLRQLEQFTIEHISCYALSVEQRTALHQLIKRGKIPTTPEDTFIKHFYALLQWATDNNFEQYELANFAKNNAYSQHNSNYWSGKPYLGVGAAAHSYNGVQRFWNIAHNQKYIDALTAHTLAQTSEILTPTDRANEYIMTSLRTCKGLCISRLQTLIDKPQYNALLLQAQEFSKQNLVCISASHIYCTPRGFMLSDYIIASLFVE